MRDLNSQDLPEIAQGLQLFRSQAVFCGLRHHNKGFLKDIPDFQDISGIMAHLLGSDPDYFPAGS